MSASPMLFRIVLCLTGALLFVWPLAHTITLRDLLLVASLLLLGYVTWRTHQYPWLSVLRAPVEFIVGFTAWIVIVALFLSPEPLWSLDEIRGQWLKALIAFVVGWLAAGVASADRANHARFTLMLWGVLLVHVVAVDVSGVVMFIQNTGPRATGLTGTADKASYLSNLALVFTVAEILVRRILGVRLLPLSDTVLYAGLGAILFSLYVGGSRSGVAVASLICFVSMVLVLRHSARATVNVWLYPIGAVVAFILAIGLLALAGMAKPGSGWRQFVSTVPLALDTQGHKGWLNESKYGLPTLPDGGSIDSSAYVRIAWFKEGLVLAGEHPLGVGFGRNAFGHAVTAKYGEAKGHSHSGFIDLLVGVGIPGMVLWLGFLFSLAWSVRHNLDNGWSIALLLLVVDFSTRMLIDSNTRDHMLQMFLFLAAFLAVAAAGQRGAKAAPAA